MRSRADVAAFPHELETDEIAALRDAVAPDSARELDHLMSPEDEPVRPDQIVAVHRVS